MTGKPTDQPTFEELVDKVRTMEGILLTLLQHKAQRAKTSARRLEKMHNQEVMQYELFDGLAGDLEGLVQMGYTDAVGK